MKNFCVFCKYFIGAGDWDLCCDLKHEGYPFGFLCYEKTEACEKFEEDYRAKRAFVTGIRMYKAAMENEKKEASDGTAQT